MIIRIDTTTIRRNRHYENNGLRRHIPGVLTVTIDGEPANIRDVGAAFIAGRDVEIQQEMTDVTTLSEPAYFYEYIDQIVQCECCGQVFSHTKLKRSYGLDFYMENTCPFCDEVECCDIEFEDIEECIRDNKIKELNIPYND